MPKHSAVGLIRVAPSLVALCIALTLAGCGTDPKKIEDSKSASQLYEEARTEAAAGAYEQALKLYERLEGVAAGTLLAQQAQLEQAYILHRQQEKARALAVVDRFLRLHPTSPAADYALYLQGLVNFNDDLGLFGNLLSQDLSERDQQASRDAYNSFKQLVERYPESRYTPDALSRMKYIVATLAAYEVHVARYYHGRGAHVAAANRAQQALQDFRGVPAAEEALFLMVTSYDSLGLTQLRDDARRVLEKNYPNSALLGDASANRPAKRWWPF